MKLIFEETKNRSQCAAETVINDLKMQCTFSTAKVVIIPTGLSYACGELKLSETVPSESFSICPNHEIRLKNAFAELFPAEKLNF